ncbi:MAG: hypothetical protein AAGB34_02305 [Planctomycetota bacterium]
MLGRICCHKPTASLWSQILSHLPFTAFGAVVGITILWITLALGMTGERYHAVFMGGHALHLIGSAFATTALIRLMRPQSAFLFVAPLTVVTAVLLCHTSDVLIPILGERLAGFTGAHTHAHNLEAWAGKALLALAGVVLGWRFVTSKLPHLGHVLVSTAASAAHLGMSGASSEIGLVTAGLLTAVLAIAVWLPCCVSDVVIPVAVAKFSAVGQPASARDAHPAT